MRKDSKRAGNEKATTERDGNVIAATATHDRPTNMGINRQKVREERTEKFSKSKTHASERAAIARWGDREVKPGHTGAKHQSSYFRRFRQYRSRKHKLTFECMRTQTSARCEGAEKAPFADFDPFPASDQTENRFSEVLGKF